MVSKKLFASVVLAGLVALPGVGAYAEDLASAPADVAAPDTALGEPAAEDVRAQADTEAGSDTEAPVPAETAGDERSDAPEQVPDGVIESEEATEAVPEPEAPATRGVESQAASGWQTEADGSVSYYDAGGTKAVGERLLTARDGSGSNWYYFRGDGSLVTGEVFRHDDAQHTGWYYFDEQTGAMAHGWQSIPSSGGKKVYYDPGTGIMWHGEGLVQGAQEQNPGWYYFDDVTGATTYGWKYLPSGSKWVYYDPEIGYMHHGECYVTGSGGDGWCHFDESTGATTYGWKYLAGGSKWVYYDAYTGRMHHGEWYVSKDDAKTDDPIPGWCYFDEVTGATQYGWKHLPDGRYVYYDDATGRMYHGSHVINGGMASFDDSTGALDFSLSSDIAATWSLRYDAPVDNLILRRHLSGERASVRVLGDSISAGPGVVAVPLCDGDAILTSDGTYHEGRLDYPIWSNFLRDYAGTFFNASIPSKSTVWFDGLGALPTPEDGTTQYDETLIVLGMNDGEQTPEAFEKAIRSLILKAKDTSSHVTVISPTPRREESVWLPIETVSEVEERVCTEMGVSYIDLYHDFQEAAAQRTLEWNGLFADLVHPSVRGQQVIWGVISARLGL